MKIDYKTFNLGKTIQAINYIVSNSDKKYKTEIIKLIFLADRSHYRKYGRTLTYDIYRAQKFGPVAIETKGIIESAADGEGVALLNEFLEVKRDLANPSNIEIKSIKEVDKDYLSETDIETLDDILKKHGDKTGNELIDFTHTLPEWKELYDDNKGWKNINLKDFIDKSLNEEDKTSDYARDILTNY